ncbi:hypothetical protein ACRALDRAFT_1065445 [Sodiomyces alcalophilus JCM 7366]|uniref:uncharacterized protein n=1 Tax=Sodiomyces alcalophilus JCM 7366 TaxID=591952 RepID=UPI0039B47910
MTIVQVAQVQFKELVVPEEVQALCEEALALKDQCLHPTTKKPLVQSVTGGIDNSTEGQQGGMTHVFILEFDNEEDRRVYQQQDERHRKFREDLSTLAAKVTMVDFCPGVFWR